MLHGNNKDDKSSMDTISLGKYESDNQTKAQIFSARSKVREAIITTRGTNGNARLKLFGTLITTICTTGVALATLYFTYKQNQESANSEMKEEDYISALKVSNNSLEKMIEDRDMWQKKANKLESMKIEYKKCQSVFMASQCIKNVSDLYQDHDQRV